MAEIMLKGFQCERCRHKWVPREDEQPRVCPKCKSPYWNVARRKGFNIEEKKQLK
jgi:Zn finger protein HypA/HybF involved in hydrogenase expression